MKKNIDITDKKVDSIVNKVESIDKKVDERDLATICLSIIQAYNDYYERDCIAEFFLSMENYEKLEGVDRIYYEGIKERMEADDTKVFELFF